MNERKVLPKGVFWDQLQPFEKREIQAQMPNIIKDPMLRFYKFYKTSFNKWLIPNAMLVPMKTSKVIL